LFGHLVNQQGALGAVIPLVVLGRADKVRVDLLSAGFGVADNQSGATLAAEHCAFEVVVMDALPFTVDVTARPEPATTTQSAKAISVRGLTPKSCVKPQKEQMQGVLYP